MKVLSVFAVVAACAAVIIPGTALAQDAAADAARRAVSRGKAGVYNVAEEDGTVSSDKAVKILGWRPDFRIDNAR